MLTQLIYTSHSVQPMSEAKLAEILVRSIANNCMNNLTGMLLYRDGTFIQLLEGQGERVDAVFRKIQSDSRHERVCLHLRTPCKEREFGNWSMGFSCINDRDLQKLKGYTPFGNGRFNIDALASNPQFCVDILKMFAEDRGCYLEQAA